MRNLQFTDNLGQTWKQVQKRTAEKLFNKGEILVFCPCNFVPFGIYDVSSLVEPKRYLHNGYNFESAVNSFEYYNCGSEQGHYTTFYKKA